LVEFIILLMQKVQLDKNAASSACQKDRYYIEKLETELMNYYISLDIWYPFQFIPYVHFITILETYSHTHTTQTYTHTPS